MILAATTVENVDEFLEVFGTKGADKRALHGSKGATVFRDPTEENRVWALFEWDEQGWTDFVSDPEVPPILKEAGHLGKPQSATLPRRLPGVGEEWNDDQHDQPSGTSRRDHRPDRRPLLHGRRQRQRGQDGDR